MNSVKKWILPALFSYFLIIVLFIVFIFIPQRNIILKYTIERESLEYNYLRLKNNPSFLNSIRATIDKTENRINNFEWLLISEDPNFKIFEHLEKLASKNNMEIISLKPLESKSELYYFWELKISGEYKNLLSFVYNLEADKNYLKIEGIEILTNEKNNFFILKIAGIKKVK